MRSDRDIYYYLDDDNFIKEFVKESNKIENINFVRKCEIEEFNRFYCLDKVTVEELEAFVKIYQPNARLRDEPGLNVTVGGYIPPPGGIMIRTMLMELLEASPKLGAYETHVKYEKLHPFTDCNGRSGRMLWAWQHRNLRYGFLQSWYYQSLRH